MVLGDRLGLYRALAPAPLSSAELASHTGTHERYVREWLNNQAAGGYVDYDAASGKSDVEQLFAIFDRIRTR